MTLCGVIFAGVLPGYIQWELAADKDFRDIKWSVTYSDVVLNRFDRRQAKV